MWFNRHPVEPGKRSMTPFALVFESHGVCVSIKTNTLGLLDAMQKHLPPQAKLTDGQEADDEFSVLAGDEGYHRVYVLYHGSELLVRTGKLDIVLDELESQLHATVALGSSTMLFVHAGVVGCQAGAIVIPGRSMSGKTSLVAALVKAGAAYYSDEYAVFDQDGYVHPYPKALSVRTDQPKERNKISAEALGGHIGAQPLLVALVVSSQYEAQARWQPQILSPGQTVLRLFDNTIDALRRPLCAIDIFARVAAACFAISGPRPSSEQVAPSLLALCDPANDRSSLTGDP